jgi:MFS family permease
VSAVPTAGADRARLQRRTLRVLVVGQVLGGAGTGVGAAVSPLLAKELLGDDTFAGLAFAAFAFGAALAAVPLSKVMARLGRRAGIMRGYAVATAGAGLAVLSAETGAFALLLAGMLLFGAGSASNLLSRYAGADLADADHRARAISTVVWATTVGAVAGPNVLGPSGRLATAVELPALAGPYLVASVAFLLAALVIGVLLRPDPMQVAGLLDRPSVAVRQASVATVLAGVARHRGAAVGLATMAVAHGVMVSIMTMTPLHLRDHGDSLEVVGLVVSLHVAGMYAFAPVVGMLADRTGHLRVAHAAAGTLVGAGVLAAVAGHDHVLVALALVALGLAWSMATISGATLLTTATPPAERARVQGVADMTMGLMGGTGGTVAGLVVGTVGYASLSLVGAVVATGLLAAVVLWGAAVPPAVAAPEPAPEPVP